MLVPKIYKAVKASYYWDRALQAASRGEYEESLKNIQMISDIGRLTLANSLLKGFLCYAMCNYRESLEILSRIEGELEKSRKYNQDEKRYLKCYASVWRKRALEKFSELEGETAIANVPCVVDYLSVDLNKIPKHLKDKFPLRSHPAWVGH